ncbi:hypothetical protein [Blautia sp. An81]|uniref:hypothetical protein n=1 Tax=Blautia sp. An81 TaxID=1965659 RepID=UPI000B37F168|nr:hypothetical protein [Blautia sp. An81]OUN27785.1 hypothetical protein B5G33_13205 [Blautia sp. An81]
MDKMILADKTELAIKEGAAIGSATTVVDDFTALGTVAAALTKEGNLESVKFSTDDSVTGEYTGMKLESPLFSAVDLVGGKVEATFGIREKTELEKRVDSLEGRADVTEGALQEMILSTMGGE